MAELRSEGHVHELLDNPREERAAVARLARLVYGRDVGPMTVHQLIEACAPRSVDAFVCILATLARQGVLRHSIEIKPADAPIALGAFASLREVPTRVRDPRTGEDRAVRPSELQLRYQAVGPV